MRVRALSLLALAGLLVAGGGSSSSQSTTAGSEAASAAAGDIPDNQVFLTYKNQSAGYSITYPEGWTRKGSGSDVTFSDKDNSIHITVKPGPKPPVVGPASKKTTTQQGPPDPVTGKRLTLSVDRYVYYKNGQVATLDLASPVGVDNVDAYRLISESFKWL